MNIVKKILLGNYPSFLSSIDGDDENNDEDGTNNIKNTNVVCDKTTNTVTTQAMDNNNNNNACTNTGTSIIPLSSNNTNNSINHSLRTKIITVPNDCGIMIELFNDDSNTNSSTHNTNFDYNDTGMNHQQQQSQQQQQQQQQQTRVLLHTAVPDKLYEHIHPNCHAPAYLHDVHLLHGGGSGTAVFHGLDSDDDSTNDTSSKINNNNNNNNRHYHHTLGSIVMKHGGYKDANEVFSLITIRQELINRIEYQQQFLKREAYTAAERMRYKIPEFIMVYISSYHLRDRQQELWNSLRTFSISTSSPLSLSPVSVRTSTSSSTSSPLQPTTNRMSMSRRLSTYEKKSSYDTERKLQRTIQLNIGKVDDTNNSIVEKWESTPKVITVTMNSNIVPFEEINDSTNNNNNNNNKNRKNNDKNIYIIEDGIDGLQRFAKILQKQMADHQWKVTLAQKTIGGKNATNGASVLLSGKLNRHIVMEEDDDNVLQLPKINSDVTSTNHSQCNRSVIVSVETTTTPATTMATTETNNPLLRRLVIDFCQLMEDLSTLTYPHERSCSRMESMLQEIRTVEEALERFRNSNSANNNNNNNSNNKNQNEILYHNMDYYTDPTACISKELDLFVGAAIHKNFDPIDGRFIKLREFAVDILCTDYDSSIHDHDNNELGMKIQLVCPEMSRGPLHTIISEGQLTTTTDNDEENDENCTMPNQIQERMVLLQTYMLTENEEIPARFLATLLYRHEYDTMSNNHDSSTCTSSRRNSRIGMKHVFVNALSDRSALDEIEDRGWLELLQHATSFVHDESISTSSKSAAIDCIWTCGLTDAGLHNTFINIHRGVELFDLGEPRLEPQPAFLTKFLMSYFHTLGMEDEIGSNGKWVQRFNIIRTETGTLLLDLTDETKDKLPQIHDTFLYTLDYFIENIFYGNDIVRVLLIKYVILQLLSDSSFCIARWQEKGGGTDRYGGKEKEPLEKWIWRSLWDQYIASYVYTQLLVPWEQTHSWQKNTTTQRS